MTEPRMDPEIEELVHAIAGGSASTLLGASRADLRAALYDRPIRSGARAELLTSAERELARSHREEVAFLLRRAAYVGLVTDPRGQVHGGVDRSAVDEAAERDGLIRDARRAGVSPPEGSGARDAQRLLEECVARGSDLPSRAGRLALASLKLLPTDEARIYLAVDLIQEGQPRTAIRVLRGVLSGCPSTRDRGYAWMDLGMGRDRIGDEDGASRAYRESARLLGDPVVACHWFRSAIRSAHREDALEAARTLDGSAGEVSGALEWFAAQQRLHRARAGDGWRPHPITLRILEDIRPSLGPVSGRMADAIR